MSRELWEREYLEHAISSSTNVRPSHGAAFVERHLATIAAVDGPPRLLDLGCGGGRNVPVLEKTGFGFHGMDYAHRPLVRAGRFATRLVQASMTAPLPFGSGVFSAVTAFTSVENLRRDEDLRVLAGEVRRVLCRGGLWLVYFMTPEDAYYRPLIEPGFGDRSLTHDPVTGLRQRVYRVAELCDLFGPSLRLLDTEEFAFADIRSAGTYERRLAAGLWRRD